MATLVDHARQHIASLVADLEGDNDFMPFMTLRDREGRVIYAGLMMPDGADEKDGISDVMMGLCMVHRAVDVAFVSTSWMVTRRVYENGQPKDWDGTPPSQHPDRVEVVVLVHITPDGDQFYNAPVTRQNNKVSIGEWDAGGVTGGRFANAIKTGMMLGTKIPPSLHDYMDAEIEAGRSEELVRMLLRQLDIVRTERAEQEN